MIFKTTYLTTMVVFSLFSLVSVLNFNDTLNSFDISNDMLSNQVFAQMNTQYGDNNARWSLVYLTNNTPCSGANYSQTESYNDITKAYMKLYGFSNTEESKPKCMPVLQFIEKHNISEKTELLIVILEEDFGISEMQNYGIGGFYYYLPSVKNSSENISELPRHLIVFCDCNPFDFANPKWILSHYLSHFILTYNGQPQEIADYSIHERDHQHDQCTDKSKEDSEECLSITTYLRINGVNTALMKPVLETEGMDNCSKEDMDTLKILKTLVSSGKMSTSAYEKIKDNLCPTIVKTNITSKIFIDTKDMDSELVFYDKPITNGIKSMNVNEIISKYVGDKSLQNSIIFEFEDIMSDSGFTNTFVLNDKIRQNSIVKFHVENHPEIQCKPAKVVNYGFQVMCDAKLENTVIQYMYIN